QPAFTVVAVGTVAVGIGANTAMFSVVDGVLLRPIPYHDAARLVQVWNQIAELRLPLSEAELEGYQASAKQVSGVAGYSGTRMNASGFIEPEEVRAANVTANLFTVLEQPPAHGRSFATAESLPGQGHVAILSDRFWRRRFGGLVSTIGTTVTLDGERYEIVGVLTKQFELPVDIRDNVRPDVYLPLTLPPHSASN